MKNVFFAFVFMLTGSISFANNNVDKAIFKEKSKNDKTNLVIENEDTNLNVLSESAVFIGCSWNISIYDSNGSLVAASIGSTQTRTLGDCDRLVRAIESILLGNY